MKNGFFGLALIILCSCASSHHQKDNFDTKRQVKKKMSYYNAIWLDKKDRPKPPQ